MHGSQYCTGRPFRRISNARYCPIACSLLQLAYASWLLGRDIYLVSMRSYTIIEAATGELRTVTSTTPLGLNPLRAPKVKAWSLVQVVG